MALQERLGSLGYLALIQETVKGTALIPTDFAPLYKETIATDINYVDLTPAVGNKFKRFAMSPGMRKHTGDFEIMGEPNTAAKFFNMLLTLGTPSGSDPTTFPFTADVTTNPKSYTIDISTGIEVFRLVGFEASEVSPVWNNNEMRLNIKGSALSSVSTREITTITPGTPNSITLKTDYDPRPNFGLVAGDLIYVTKVSDGTRISATITASTGVNADGITITCDGTLTGIAAGDLVSLRPQTTTYNALVTNPFLWSNTQFCFGANATAALAAAQTRIEQSSTWKVMHDFEKAEGADRSGAFDPAALVRTLADASATIKMFFDSATQVNNFLARKDQALVIRHFVYAGAKTYELRVTMDQFKYKTGGKPPVESGNIIYHTFDCVPVFNTVNGEGLNVKVINSLSSLV